MAMYTDQVMTIVEVAGKLGCSRKRVQTALQKFAIPRRTSAKRCQIGPTNHKWKGAAAGYQAKHLRVDTLRGKPKICEVCGESDPTRVYDWANLTGDYDNPQDFKRMCRSCHRLYDNHRRRRA